MRGQRDRGIMYAGGLIVAFIVLAHVIGCGANARQRDLSETFRGVDVAAAGFEAWDAAHQESIVTSSNTRDEGESRLAAYRAKREVVIAGFEAAYRTVASAALGTGDVIGASVALESLYKLIARLEAMP